MSMSLPTPPRTIYKDKENQPPHPVTPSSSLKSRTPRIAWSRENLQHAYSEHIRELPASSCVKAPPKSILKKVTMSYLMTPEHPTREATPEPEDPLHHPLYLNSPISTLVASLRPGMDRKITLTDLTEAYSVLSARLRTKTAAMLDIYGPIPALEPLKEHSEQLVQVFHRDIGRAFTDPQSAPSTPPSSDSPWSSPSSVGSIKKRGFTEQEVKHARDLCNVCHAALRCFSNIAVVPAVYSIFTDEQLGDILTAILAIPLATSLPTPNARKTWQLSVWTLQVQLLPTAVLAPAADRIAYAIRRGIDGELGRQGKNGAASDGLKAVATLMFNQSDIFLVPFAEILPSVFANLTNSNLSLRVEAAHALLSIAFAFARCSSPVSVGASLAHATTAYLEAQNQTRKTLQDISPITRAFRQCFEVKVATHAAASPTWALSVIAAVIVLSSTNALTQSRTLKFTLGHLQTAMSHKRTTIRAASGLVWRSLVWACVQLDKSDEEVHTDQNKNSGWKVVRQLVDGAIGISIVGALVGQEDIRAKRLSDALQVVSQMIEKGGKTCEEAVDVLEQLLSRVGTSLENISDDTWEEHSLLTGLLFDGTLLRAESKNLVDFVRSCVDKTAMIRQITPLKEDEVVRYWDVLFSIWKQAVEKAPLGQDGDIPAPILNAWRALLLTQSQLTQGCENHTTEPAFMSQLVDILKSFLVNQGLEWVLDSSAPSWSSQPLKLGFVHNLWSEARNVFAAPALSRAAGSLLEEVIKHKYELDQVEVRDAWGMLCAELLLAGSLELMRKLWQTGYPPILKRGLWRTVGRQWLKHAGAYHGSIELLRTPFFCFTDVQFEREDLDLWVQLANSALIAASLRKTSAATVLDAIASQIKSSQNSMALFAVLPSLLSGIQPDNADAQLPSVLLRLTNDTLTVSYPPLNDVAKPMLFDVVDRLTEAVNGVGGSLIVEYLKAIQEGMKLMIEDQSESFMDDEYNEHVIAFYIAALKSLKITPVSSDTLHSLTPLLASAFTHIPPPALGPSAFKAFWAATYGCLGSLELRYPEELKPILRNIQEVMCDSNEEFAPGISQATQTQKQSTMTIIHGSHHQSDHETTPVIRGTPRLSSGLKAFAANESISAKAELNADAQALSSPIIPNSLLTSNDIFSVPKVTLPAGNVSTNTPNESDTQPRLNTDATITPSKQYERSLVASPLTSISSKSSPLAEPHIKRENSDMDTSMVAYASEMGGASQIYRSGSVLGKRRKSRLSQANKRRKSGPAPDVEIINVSDDENPEITVAESIIVTRLKRKRSHLAEASQSPQSQLQETSTLDPTSKHASSRSINEQRRKIFDAVEIPRIDSKRLAQYDNTSEKSPSKLVRGSNKVLFSTHERSCFEDDITRETPNPPKRRRVGHEPLKREVTEAGSDILQEDVFNSNNDLGLPQTPQQSSDPSLPSSRAGRISARHIMSPLLRRSRSEAYDPPSDDSLMSSSPLKKVAARRQLNRAKTVPPNSALGSDSPSHNLSRLCRRNLSEEYLALEQAHVAITNRASNMAIQELLDASRMASGISMALNDQMAKKFSSPHTATESP
ncbi:hypothetical protein BU17DRAFT_71831 [Hysterangium stoloniferum]|nr:hypothetical protein BU17DRAFT_71831 [Hysterangium stoloniferum]